MTGSARSLPPFALALCGAVLALLVLPAAALALIGTGNGAWQWQNPLPQGNGYASGYFLDATHGWLISGSTIFHTTNGGRTLTVQARHNVDFSAITFVGTRCGWAAGAPAGAKGTGILYRTTNGGQRWTRVRLQWRGAIKAIGFATTKVGWATIGHRILHTTNGGLTWSAQKLGSRDRPEGVAALSARRAWIADGFGSHALLRTVDGGRSWQHVHLAQVSSPGLVVFKGARNGWVGDIDQDGGQIAHTSDGGLHWTVQLSGPVSGLSFADRDHGWAAVDGTVYHTADGGVHWAPEGTAPPASWVEALTPLVAVTGASSDSSYTGYSGRLSHTTDGGTSWQPSTRAAGDYFGTLTALQFSDALHGWAVGGGGEVLATTDGGLTWTAQTSNTSAGLSAVHFVDRSNGWAVGDQGTIIHTSDGGATWASQSSGTSYDLTGVTFTDAQTGWATGQTFTPYDDYSSGVILHTTDGGQHWTTQYASPFDLNTMNAGVAFSAVTFTDAQDGWAVGETQGSDSTFNSTVIMHTSDAGATWTKQLDFSPPYVSMEDDATLTSVACTDAEHAVAVGYDDDNAEIWRTTNGGQTWTRVAQKLWPRYGQPSLSDVVFADATHGWAVGGGEFGRAAYIIHTSDGGATWTKQLIPNDLDSEPLDALSFVNPTLGWAAGEGGDILKTTTGGFAPAAATAGFGAGKAGARRSL